MSSVINYEKAGERIRAKRIGLGWTQEYICGKLDISTGFYSYIESGKRKAGLNTFYMLSELLDLSLDYILHGKVNIPKVQDAQLAEILSLSEGFSTEKKQILLDVAKSLNERLK